MILLSFVSKAYQNVAHILFGVHIWKCYVDYIFPHIFTYVCLTRNVYAEYYSVNSTLRHRYVIQSNKTGPFIWLKEYMLYSVSTDISLHSWWGIFSVWGIYFMWITYFHFTWIIYFLERFLYMFPFLWYIVTACHWMFFFIKPCSVYPRSGQKYCKCDLATNPSSPQHKERRPQSWLV